MRNLILSLAMALSILAAISEAQPEVSDKVIVMFGDSTTAPRPETVKQVYAVRIGEELSRSDPHITIHNAGIGGNTTRDAMTRFQSDVLAYNPTLIVIQFGINDAAVDVWQSPPATQPRVPLPEYRQNLRTMITTAQKAQIKVILMTTNPMRWTTHNKELYGKPPYDPANPEGFEQPFLLKYNAALRQLARELDVPLIDVHASYFPWAKQNGLSIKDMLPDGIHPNDLGHSLVAELLSPVIRRLLP